MNGCYSEFVMPQRRGFNLMTAAQRSRIAQLGGLTIAARKGWLQKLGAKGGKTTQARIRAMKLERRNQIYAQNHRLDQ